MSRSPRPVRWLALLAGGLAPLWLCDGYTLFQLCQAGCYAIAILGLTLLTGVNGQFSLGHSAFYALGAYTAALAGAALSPYLCLPLAAASGFLAGLLIGLPALRFGGHHLAVATFALAVATPQLLRFDGLARWTGGNDGLWLTRPGAPSGVPLDVDQWWYLVVLAVLLTALWLASNLIDSRSGRALRAIREQPVAAAVLGVDVARYKLLVFGVSGACAAVAGALAAIVVEYVAPDSFTFSLSILLLIGLVVGGVGSVWGAPLGGAFILFAPNLAERWSTDLAEVGFGLLLILSVLLFPGGLSGAITRSRCRLQTWWSGRRR